MNDLFNSEEAILRSIIDREGECVNVAWCLQCPFMDICVGRAVREGKILPKEDRVRKANDKLFEMLVEEELDDNDE